MSMSRIQIVVDEAERERFRACARAEGMSLSEWLRELGRERLAVSRPKRLVTSDDLSEFFEQIKRDYEPGAVEEDWETTKERLDGERYGAIDPLGIDS